MDFGKNIIFCKEKNKSLVLTKYRKLREHKHFKKEILNYVTTNFDEKFDHEWINNIIYFTNKNKLYVYFKKYFILELDVNIINNYKSIVKQIIDEVIITIKNKNIKLSINYIFDILNLNYNSITQEKFKLLNKCQIEFCICNNTIKFFIKNNELLECNINEIKTCVNEELYNNYKKKESTMIKVAFCTYYYDTYYNKDYIYDWTKHMFSCGYWLDFIPYHSYVNNTYKNKVIIKQNEIIVKYNIIIYDTNTITTLLKNKIYIPENKVIIVLSSRYSGDVNTTYNILNKEKIIYYGITPYQVPNMLNNSYLWGLTGGVTLRQNGSYFQKFKRMYCPKIKYSVLNNDSLLDKKDFFKIYNLDINKKLVTVFIEWPQVQYHDLKTIKDITYMERLIYSEDFSDNLSKIIKTFKSNNCNVIFKIHPSENMFIVNNKIYFINCSFNKNLEKNEQVSHNQKKDGFCVYLKDKDFGIKPLLDRYIFVDNSFTTEIQQYTDLGIVFSSTTVSWFSYIYNIPIISISDKYYDWFPFMYNSTCYRLFKTIMLNHQVINEIQTFKGIFTNWMIPYGKNKGTRYNKISKFIWDSNFCLGDMIYGDKFYWRDLINNPELITNFINTDFSKDYKYFNNNPFYGDTYSETYECITEIIKMITHKSKQEGIEFLNEKRYNVNDLFYSTIYGKEYIKHEMNKDKEIILEIINIPIKDKKLASCGINFPYFSCSDNYELTELKFHAKIEEDEDEPVYPRIYTGISWEIIKPKLSKKYQEYSLKNNFDFTNKSRWRIFMTSITKSQKLYIKNITLL